VRDFGAFVDLGGIEGLVHVSELSHARVAHAQEAVKVGQKVRVQVLRIEQDKEKSGKTVEKIALSLKALEQDPWDAHRGEISEGQKLQGKIMRLQPFGAFVEMFPGVDGLVHVSTLSDRHVAHPRDVVKEGETIWVQIEQIDDSARRVALRRITDEEAAQEGPVAPRAHAGRGNHEGGKEPREQKPSAPRAKPGDVVECTVERVEVFGVFVTWASGALRGLIPNQELGTPRGSDNKKTNPVGSTFKAQILDIDERGRYRLSKTSAEAALDRGLPGVPEQDEEGGRQGLRHAGRSAPRQARAEGRVAALHELEHTKAAPGERSRGAAFSFRWCTNYWNTNDMRSPARTSRPASAG